MKNIEQNVLPGGERFAGNDVFFGNDAKDLGQRHAGQFVMPPCQQALGKRVRERDESVRVDGNHRGVHVVQDHR